MNQIKYDAASIRRLIEIARLVKGKQILDIGCRDGFLKNLLPPDVEYCGLETMEVQPYSQECRILKGDIGNSETLKSFEEKYFDTIVLGETLEHLSNPLQALENIRGLMVQHGQLVGSVPNALSWRFFFLLEFLEKPAPEETIWDGSQHLFSFTKSTLSNLLSRAGFKVRMVKEWGNWVPHTGIFLPFNTRGGHLIFVADR